MGFLRKLFGGDKGQQATPALVPTTTPPRARRPGWVELPESDEDLLAMMLGTGKGAICLAPVVPPDWTSVPTSFIGGLPYVSASFVWPRGVAYKSKDVVRSRGFVGQIDCASLPSVEGRDMLPRDGRLCFFVDWDALYGHAPHDMRHPDAVIYDRNDGGPLHEHAAPADLPPCHGELVDHYFEWLQATDRSKRGYPTSFPKWPLRLDAIRSYPDFFGDGQHDDRYDEVRSAEMREQFLDIYGEPPIDRMALPAPGLLRPTPTFPECWIHVEIFAGLLMKGLNEKLKRPDQPKDGWPEDPEKLQADYTALLGELTAIVADARDRGLFTPLTETERAEFYEWYGALAAAAGTSPAAYKDRRSAIALHGPGINALHIGADLLASQSPETAALLDDATLDLARIKRAPVVRGRKGPKLRAWHQMLGHGGNVQAAAEQFGSTHVMLAQFASDQTRPWMWGDMGKLQYWMAEDDLRAGNFQRVKVTLESH